jgi:thiol-disulfide isomerase/thioredoxin
MKNIFKNITKSIKTELIKKKGSGIFTLSIAIGILIPLIGFITQIISQIKGENEPTGIPVNFYFENITNYLNPFCYLFFPLLIIYCASKIAQIDHKNKGWHLMETLPTTKFSIYFSKYTILLISNLMAIVTFLLVTLFFGFLESLFFEIPADKILAFPLLEYIEIGFRLFLVGLCISAIQYGLSVLISSFIWPIIIGFITMLIPSILSDLNIVLNWYPYQFLKQIPNYPSGSDFGYWLTYSELLSSLYAILILYISFNWYRFKVFVKAFLIPKKRFLKLMGVVCISGIFIFYTLLPKQQNKSDKTLIQGHISSDKNIQNVYVFDGLVGDTLAKIPVINQQFKYQFSEKIAPDNYIIQFENYTQHLLFFGEMDSLNLSYKLFGTEEDFKVKGTRAAENIQENNRRSYVNIMYYLENNSKIDDADFYMDNIYESWQKNISKINTIRTVDNIIPKNDYIQRLTKLTSLIYLDYWNSFKEKREALYPDKIYVVNNQMKKLEESISLKDETLLSDPFYLKYILEASIKDDVREVSQNQKYFSAIEKMESGLFKDRLLFRQLNKSLYESTKVTVRDSLMQQYLTLITKDSYKKLLQKNYENYNRLSKGVTAPDFMAFDADGKNYTLDSFKGNLVLIDCWASWCGPCKTEDPYFEKKSLVYKNKPIQFISMNSDRKKKDWLVDIKGKGKSILRLRPQDLKKFKEAYAINSIPRFILIDAEGNMLNSTFVRPSSNVFDELLNINFK